MAKLSCTVPNIGVSVRVSDIKLISNCFAVSYSEDVLSAEISNGLSDEEYEKISKQIRILYGFCFEKVYPEGYIIDEPNASYQFAGHDKRKKHLLQYSGNPSKEFKDISISMFQDLLHCRLGQKDNRQLFNSLFIWSRAHELEDLKLMVEAYAQYWRILDFIQAKGDKKSAIKILSKFRLRCTDSNIVAAKIVLYMKPDEDGHRKGNIQAISNFDTLRHPHAHKPSSTEDYYLEEVGTHLSAEINNIFISYITKLYVLWMAGLASYYLKPRANIYEFSKK